MKSTQYRVWDDTTERFTVNNTETNTQISTNRKDKKGKTIFAGDIIKLHNKSEHTRREYWFPIFEVVWDGFEFSLKHLGGGKNGDNNMFQLRYYPNNFQILGNVCEGNVVIVSPRKKTNG